PLPPTRATAGRRHLVGVRVDADATGAPGVARRRARPAGRLRQGAHRRAPRHVQGVALLPVHGGPDRDGVAKADAPMAKHYDDVLVHDAGRRALGAELRQELARTENCVLAVSGHKKLSANTTACGS
ncbi:Os01g0746000, partial [Oryza sativa Japonica Group]